MSFALAVFLGVVMMLVTIHVVHGWYQGSLNRTHFWNNRRLTNEERMTLKLAEMVFAPRDPEALRRHGFLDLRFHIPLLGGWKRYVVLLPVDQQAIWHVGWAFTDGGGCTKLTLSGQVRMLRGSDDVQFFAYDIAGKQIPLQKVGEGTFGDRGPWAKTHSSIPVL